MIPLIPVTDFRKSEQDIKNEIRMEINKKSKKIYEGLEEITFYSQKLHQISGLFTFTGLLHVTPYFEKGIYKFVKGVRIYLDYYNNNKNTINIFFKKQLNLKREEIYKSTNDVRNILLKLAQWFPLFLKICDKNTQDLKWKLIRGIEKFEELDFMLLELLKLF